MALLVLPGTANSAERVICCAWRTSDEGMGAGWARMALLVLYFSPDHLRNPSNFEAVSNRLICSPVTQILVFTKVQPHPNGRLRKPIGIEPRPRW